jgi:hypothetical protein
MIMKLETKMRMAPMTGGGMMDRKPATLGKKGQQDEKAPGHVSD